MTKWEKNTINELTLAVIDLVKEINKMIALQMVLIKYLQRMTEPS